MSQERIIDGSVINGGEIMTLSGASVQMNSKSLKANVKTDSFNIDVVNTISHEARLLKKQPSRFVRSLIIALMISVPVWILAGAIAYKFFR